MKKIFSLQVMEFTYESEEERNHHVGMMKLLEGWEDTGTKKKLKEGVHLMNATDEDYEWYARFTK